VVHGVVLLKQVKSPLLIQGAFATLYRMQTSMLALLNPQTFSILVDPAEKRYVIVFGVMYHTSARLQAID
jgi:hypothetical protein